MWRWLLLLSVVAGCETPLNAPDLPWDQDAESCMANEKCSGQISIEFDSSKGVVFTVNGAQVFPDSLGVARVEACEWDFSLPGQYSTMWSVDGVASDLATTGVSYGVVPQGAKETHIAEPLVVGDSYRATLHRSAPDGGAPMSARWDAWFVLDDSLSVALGVDSECPPGWP